MSKPGSDCKRGGGSGGQTREEEKACVQQSGSKELSPDLLFPQRKPPSQPPAAPCPPRRGEAGHQASAFVSERTKHGLTFPHSYCLSSFKMTSRKAIMKFTWGVQGGRGRGGRLPPPRHMGAACVRVSVRILSPRRWSPRAGERRRLIYLMTTLISSGGTGWQRGSFVNTLPMNPWGADISVYSPR